jgi:hypothetical protein
MKSKQEIIKAKEKEVAEAISTPEGRMRIACGAYELYPVIHQTLVANRQNDRRCN